MKVSKDPGLRDSVAGTCLVVLSRNVKEYSPMLGV